MADGIAIVLFLGGGIVVLGCWYWYSVLMTEKNLPIMMSFKILVVFKKQIIIQIDNLHLITNS